MTYKVEIVTTVKEIYGIEYEDVVKHLDRFNDDLNKRGEHFYYKIIDFRPPKIGDIGLIQNFSSKQRLFDVWSIANVHKEHQKPRLILEKIELFPETIKLVRSEHVAFPKPGEYVLHLDTNILSHVDSLTAHSYQCKGTKAFVYEKKND